MNIRPVPVGGRAVWWVKRDMRLDDNPALSAARREHAQVLPAFFHEPSLVAAPDTSPMHVDAWLVALDELRRDVERGGGAVWVAETEAVAGLEALRGWYPFTALYAHQETGNGLTYARDKAVIRWCRRNGVEYREFAQNAVKRGPVDRDRLPELWKSRIVDVMPLPRVCRLPVANSVKARCAEAWRRFSPGRESSPYWQPVAESHAHRTLDSFLEERGEGYSGGISSPLTAFTAGSRLSTHLAWGTLTARQVYHATADRLRERELAHDPRLARWRRGLTSFLARLHWRDHFTQRLETEPAMEFHALHPSFRAVPYEDDPNLLAAFAAGRTGFPMVDATMRCLAATGFANFRMRAMSLSLACHALHLSWQAAHFPLCRVFRDYDPGIHFSQVQMQAGVVGFNTVRVYSPWKQMLDQDPQADWVREWVPELRPHSAERIARHQFDPVPGYTRPVVDFVSRTREMKDWIFGRRKEPETIAQTPGVYAKHGSRRPPIPPRRPARPTKKVRMDQPSLF